MNKIIFLVAVIFSLVGSVSAGVEMTSRVSFATGDDRYLNIANENDIFELDTNGDVMPSASGRLDAHFEEDQNGAIQPKDQDCFTQNADGDYQPVE